MYQEVDRGARALFRVHLPPGLGRRSRTTHGNRRGRRRVRRKVVLVRVGVLVWVGGMQAPRSLVHPLRLLRRMKFRRRLRSLMPRLLSRLCLLCLKVLSKGLILLRRRFGILIRRCVP